MLSWFSSLQFISTAAFSLAAVAPLLIFAYLKRHKGKTHIVSSLFLLQTLTKQARLKRKIQLPLRFFLELLALLLLVTALTQPFQKESGNRRAILLDNSLSMNARSSSGLEGQTRFLLAIDAAKNWIDDQDSRTKFSVFTSTPKLERHGADALTRSEAKDMLSSLSVVSAPDSLSGPTQELASSGTYDEVSVFTDKSPEFADAKKIGTENSRDTIIHVRQVGEPAPNVYVSFARTENNFGKNSGKSSEDEENASSIRVGISFSGPASRYADGLKAVVSVRALNSNNAIAEQRVTLFPERLTEVSLSLPPSATNLDAARIDVKVPQDANSVTEDDTAWISFSQTANTTNILLVSPLEKSGDALGLKSIPGFSVSQIRPEEFSYLGPDLLSRFSLYIFHRSAPSSSPRNNTLLILPPSENPLFPVNGNFQEPKISSWISEHPLTRYLRVPLLQLPQVMTFAVPLWAQSILNVEQGSVLLAGESEGLHYAAVGFEMLPFEGMHTPALSILTLNLVHWLTSTIETGTGTLTGSSVRLEPNKVWIIKTPTGTIENRSSATKNGEQETLFYSPSQPGIYQLVGADIREPQNREAKTLAVNSFFPEESATFTTSSFSTQRLYVHEEQSESLSATPYWPLLIQLVLGVLLLDLTLRNLRKEVTEKTNELPV